MNAPRSPRRHKEDGSPVKAIGLISGGLDSTLAAKLIHEQGIEVLGINFSTGFCRSDHHRAMGALGKDQDPRRLRNEALRAGSDLEIPVRIVDISGDYLSVVLKPKHGYGANMNPCLDCRAFMLRAARRIMDEEGADFVFTGEVLGQRPMSQHLRAMQLIEKESGLSGRLLRPLSARLLAPTEVERRGWVDREALLRIQGRTRREQLRLADEAGLDEIPAPAGGCCFLTDKVYASRLHDVIMHLPPGTEPIPQDVLLLKVGRHFRIGEQLKCVVGREEAENNFLRHFFPAACQIEARDFLGPLAIIHKDGGGAIAPEEIDAKVLALFAAAVARYGKGRHEASVTLLLRCAGGEEEIVVSPLQDDARLAPYRVPEKFIANERPARA